MEQIEILGGHSLFGEIQVQGSKNGVLPVMAASLLYPGVTVLHNCPRISDVMLMMSILEELGCKCTLENHTMTIDASAAKDYQIPEKYGKTMRSSITLAGSLLGRFGQFSIPYPGGCVIGSRPIDFHLQAFEAMGAEIKEEGDIITGEASCLQGCRLHLPFPSVGATENIILAAVLAKGRTLLSGAAREPEVVELCSLLKGMGACIDGEGTERICITGVRCLHESEYILGSDRIVAGTYLLAAAGSRGKISIVNAPVDGLKNLKCLLEQMGAVWQEEDDRITLDGEEACQPIPYVRTAPYPGFSTDLQSQLLAVLSIANGESIVEERIFEARFKIVEPLRAMGAQIQVEGSRVRIHGIPALIGQRVKAGELRGGAALVVAGLLAEGKTVIENLHFIDRGYEDICADLTKAGAAIRRRNT